MSSEEESLRYVFHIVAPSKNRDCVIGEVMPNGDLRLPRIDISKSLDYLGLDKIERCVETEWGICGNMILSLFIGEDTRIEGKEGMEEHEVLLFEIVDDRAFLQKPLQWISRKDALEGKWMLTNGEDGDEHVNEVLDDIFIIINGEEEQKLEVEAWENMGWYEELMSWTRKVLESQNMVMDGRIYQRHRRDTSIVLSGEVIREAQRTATIRNVIGNIVPEIIGIDETRDIMIERNGGKGTDAPWDQEGLIKTILRMHSLSMNRTSELEAGGFLVADSRWAESHVEWILNHELLDECWKRAGSEEEKNEKKRVVDGARSRVSLIKEDFRKITSLGLPKTIVQGDLQDVGRRALRWKKWKTCFL